MERKVLVEKAKTARRNIGLFLIPVGLIALIFTMVSNDVSPFHQIVDVYLTACILLYAGAVVVEWWADHGTA